MKTSIRNKKGFTIVELVIVIAVIAILAAVLIPTFANLVEKANQSADIQACRQMNTQLAIANAESPIDNIADAIIALDKANIDLDNYKPLTADCYFYYVNDKNGTPTIIYADAEDKVLYPEGFDITGLQLMTLSGEIPTEVIEIPESGEVTITSGAQLAYLMQNRNPEQELTITLSGDIDLKGCAVGFGKVKQNITLQGEENGTATLKGIREDTNALNGAYQGVKKSYGFGIFGSVTGSNVTVTIKNINVSNIVVANTDDMAFGHSAILVGRVDNGAKVVIEDVAIDNCSVYGGDKVGALIGSLQGTTSAELKNVKINNSNIYGLGWIAKAVGYVPESCTLTIENVTSENIAIGINEDKWSTLWYESDPNWITGSSAKITDVKVFENIHATNTYMGYTTNGKNHFEGMVTNDLYWCAVWTQYTVDSKTGIAPTSGNETYTPSSTQG